MTVNRPSIMLGLLFGILVGAGQASPPSSQPRFEKITSHVGIYHDAVNVGVIRSQGQILLIDSGDGSILKANKSLNLGRIAWVLYTHYHRDQCSGAPALKRVGVKIGVPASEARFFRNATQFWLHADSILYHRYNFRPEPFVLRQSVEPDRELKPGDVFEWQGLAIHAIATPGHTDGSLTYLVTIDGKKLAFTGDLIYGPGQIWEFYSLDKRFPGMRGGYWGFGGAVSTLLKSLDRVLAYKPSILVPSHGVVMTDPAQSVELLRERLAAVMKNYFTVSAWRIYQHQGNPIFKKDVNAPFNVPMLAPLPAVKAPAWLHRSIETSSYIEAEDKSIFLFDCGFPPIVGELDRLVKTRAIAQVDGIWISHYHDDHLSSVNAVVRKYGARVYAQRELQDILENPLAYSMPCLYPKSIHVDHPLSEGEVLHWKGYTMTAFYFPGQTLYHDGLLVEHDGTKVFMTGDSLANWGIDDYCSYNRNFIGADGETYGYQRCLRLLIRVNPDLLMAAHWGPEPISREYLQKTLQLLEARQKLLAKIFPWNDPNFGLDPYWVRAYPYHQNVLPGQEVTLEARIFNHSDVPEQAFVELRAPRGWRVKNSGSATILPHTEGEIRLKALAPLHPAARRQVLGLAVHFGGRNLGEFAEALVDYLQ